MVATDIRFKINGVEYKWLGGYGAILSSNENGLKRDELRIIDHHMFYVYQIKKSWFKKDEISWCLVDPVTTEFLDYFRGRLFGFQSKVK